jgi:ABC-2 type transport system ATP-binding protein
VIDGFTIQLVEPQVLAVAVPKISGLNRLFEGLTALGIDVLSLKNKSNRLEQLFIDLVQ